MDVPSQDSTLSGATKALSVLSVKNYLTLVGCVNLDEFCQVGVRLESLTGFEKTIKVITS